MKSMTGFGNSRINKDNVEVEFEIKSVNSRYLDLRLYLPRELSFFEAAIRKLLPHYISRGAIEIRVNFTDHREPKLQLDTKKLLKYNELASAAATQLNVENNVSIEFLLHEPGVVINEDNLADDPILTQILIEALTQALEKVSQSMITEATNMKSVLLHSMHLIEAAIASISQLCTPFKQELYMNMLTRVQEIITSYNIANLEQRIVQELAIYVDKYDIGEELSRLTSHISTLFETLERNEDNGKTLNFIIQEMQREANTLGSKFSTSKSFQYVLVIKEEIEKCREIIQNVA